MRPVPVSEYGPVPVSQHMLNAHAHFPTIAILHSQLSSMVSSHPPLSLPWPGVSPAGAKGREQKPKKAKPEVSSDSAGDTTARGGTAAESFRANQNTTVGRGKVGVIAVRLLRDCCVIAA